MSGRRVDPIHPPVAQVRPVQYLHHGDERRDDYYWLRYRSDPEVLRYLEAENVYADAAMASTKDLQRQLYREFIARIQETDLDVPVKMDRYFYYSRTEKGQEYRIHCRKEDSLAAGEEILIDENKLARGERHLRLGVFKVSPNHRLLAYSVDPDGSESYLLQVKDLSTGKLLEDAIPNTYYSVEWANDNRTLFYATLDETRRPYRLFRHVLGVDPSRDDLLYEETDQAFHLRLAKSRSRRFLFMSLKSNTTSEVHFLDAGRPDGDFKRMEARRPGVEYHLEHHDDRFFVRTNDRAKNFRLATAPVTNPGREHWNDLLPHREDVMIEGIDLFRDHLVVHERENGLKKIRVSDTRGGNVHYVEFDEQAYTLASGSNPEFESSQFRFVYNSLTTPPSVFDFDMARRTRELKKQYEVLGGFDRGRYRSGRIFATAADGAKVPISLVYKKDLVRNGRNPVFLYGYGAYGRSSDPTFSSSRLSLLDRGFIFAVAHVRGGEELGRSWYEQGKLLQKKNTFTDFIACAEHLIAEKYTGAGRIAIYGGSAGGLLIGAVVNMRPELFGAVIASVPFVDVLNTMLDPSIPLTVTEFEEWGNPSRKEFYEYIKSYSPYDNVTAQTYPPILVIAGLNDPRVQYWEPAKWVAKLRAAKTDRNLLLLKTRMTAGHRGASGRYDSLQEAAFQYAFLLRVMGIDGGDEGRRVGVQPNPNASEA